MRTMIPVVLSLFYLAQPTSPAHSTADEQAVWRLEEAYWKYVKENDVDGYRTLWDERFVGWPSFSRTPMGKDTIHEWIAPLHANPAEVYDYKLTKEAVRSFGDVVVAHYLVDGFFRSPRTGEIVRRDRISRITHTWQRRGDSWQIITGMSGALVEQ